MDDYKIESIAILIAIVLYYLIDRWYRIKIKKLEVESEKIEIESDKVYAEFQESKEKSYKDTLEYETIQDLKRDRNNLEAENDKILAQLEQQEDEREVREKYIYNLEGKISVYEDKVALLQFWYNKLADKIILSKEVKKTVNTRISDELRNINIADIVNSVKEQKEQDKTETNTEERAKPTLKSKLTNESENHNEPTNS